jgi:hypothetical protein
MLKKEEMRKEFELQHTAEMTGKPQISRYSEKLFSGQKQSLSIADRSRLLLDSKKAKEDQLRQQIEQKQNQEMTSVPQINKKSSKLIGAQPRGIDAQATWEENRREK